MRLHRLEVCALQAFAAREEVDFDALGAAGLFLLHGDTGAGKTTLLDAICFAFYGRLPGGRGKDARERSDHAAPEVRTEVVLEATLRGERLRITRTPRQTRPKRRGAGSTEEAATVLLERRGADGWRTLATRHDEAAGELDRLLGMSREQFCQVVLLPQGEFATFLRADSDARWEVLERLFATERFGVAEDVLTRRRKATAAQLSAARGAVNDVAQRLCQETGWPAEPEWEQEPASLGPWLQERLVGAAASQITAASVCERAATARTAADAALRAAEELAERAARHADAADQVAAFEARRPVRDAAARELFAAREAAGLAPQLKEGDRLEVAGASAQRAADTAVAELDALPPGARHDPEALRAAAAEVRAGAGAVGAYAELEAELATRSGAVAAEEERAAAAAAEATQLREQIADGPARRTRLTRDYEAARAAADALADRVAAAQEAHRRREASLQRDRLEDDLARAEALRGSAVGAAQDARARWLDVRQARLDGMAGELARGLVDGEPCRVCGALEHPDPAEDGTVADADAERAAQIAHETADARVGALVARLGDVRAALSAATAVAGTGGHRELARAAADAEHALDVARRGSMHLEDALAEVMAFDEEQARLVTRQAATAETAAAATVLAAAGRGQLEADRVRLATALAGAPDVRTRVAVLRSAAQARERAADALTAAMGACAAVASARGRLLDAARTTAFADLVAARVAVRSSEAITALEGRLRSFDDGLAARRGLLDDPALQAAAAAPEADRAALRAAALAAAEAQAQAERDHEVAERHARGLEALERQLTAALAALAPVEADAARVREMAFLVDGSAAANVKRMRLSAYVLAARLEEIAAAATLRLAAMTAGRYTIEHSDAGARGQKRGGLDLRIVDGWTGSSRHPATLSGGETFLASLALALGLADVVEAEAGGARLETLFVDEGFGSLDPTSLDMVLDVLDRLRDGGRAVGIVSHVGELRQRVPTQLHVRKGRDGSHVEQLAPVP